MSKRSQEPLSGVVFNIQRYSIEDGPGIRTTVFLKSCPLQCLWCSNPESQSPGPQLAHQNTLCKGCGNCDKACTENAIRITPIKNEFAVIIDRNRCSGCGVCIETCEGGALRFYGQSMSVEQVFKEVNEDIHFYLKSGGGVTVSGGEPLNQADFVAELFHRCRRNGIHTALDTSGYFGIPALEKVLPETDLVLFDVKIMDEKQHKKFTGKSNDVIFRNAARIVEQGVPMIVRVPLIPNITDSYENLNNIAEFVYGLNPRLHVNLLPYHGLGMGKYEMLDMDYLLGNVASQDQQLLQMSIEIFKGYGLDCEIQ